MSEIVAMKMAPAAVRAIDPRPPVTAFPPTSAAAMAS
jgi:hypothetical protein